MIIPAKTFINRFNVFPSLSKFLQLNHSKLQLTKKYTKIGPFKEHDVTSVSCDIYLYVFCAECSKWWAAAIMKHLQEPAKTHIAFGSTFKGSWELEVSLTILGLKSSFQLPCGWGIPKSKIQVGKVWRPHVFKDSIIIYRP